MVALHPYSARATAGQAHLRVLATTDLHAHVWPYDYYADRPADGIGLATAAARIAGLRRAASNAILLDNGDVLQGNPMADYIAEERGLPPGAVHPVIAAMNAAGYDAATLGNHDFNYGLDFLSAAVAGARFPVVVANVRTPEGAPFLPPFTILDRAVTDGHGTPHPLRIGVIGLLPPQIVLWDRMHLAGRLVTRDIVETAAELIPPMRAEGADIVIALAHSGIGPGVHESGMEHATVPLAALPGLDAIVAGHSHLVFPGPDHAAVAGVDAAAGTIHGKPVAMAGFWGSHVAVLDLLLERGRAGWRVAGHMSAAHETGGEAGGADAAILAATEADHAATLAHVRRPVGHTTRPVHSYFALVAPSPALQIVADAQRAFLSEALAGTPLADLPLLSAVAPFKAGGRPGPANFTEIPAGPLALRHVAELYLYPNSIRAVRVTGAQLRDWLERAARVFRQVAPGARDAPLLDPDCPSYNFDVIHGLTYEIDVSQPARHDRSGAVVARGAARIRNLRWNGRPVDPAQDFLVATNSYRAGGGGGFPGLSPEAVVFEAAETNRDIVRRHIRAAGTIDPAPARVWRFAPLPGTTVTFDTGPGARACLHELDGAEPLCETPEGFLRLRLRL